MHSFHIIFGLSKWLESVVYILFYTILEDRCISPRHFIITYSWTPVSWIHDSALHSRFNLIKSDCNFGYIHLVRWKWPEQWQWTEYSVAIHLDYRRKKNMNNQFNTHSKHSKMAGDWNCVDAKTSYKANWNPSDERWVDYYALKYIQFTLHHAWRWDANFWDAFKLNRTELKHLHITASQFATVAIL